ncbi:Relaxase/Mobilisation nuclease domain-containing protein [Pedobacter steynii]|uniref:Relaxase/Mobilisation nuclease domain-containing protein n=1 Tax=Pedobacter steynii TaxID=430522 RepID=A0A1H0G7T6_9SPHI|nr:relaxase/mobilization nuclease domain-containing protein [Pedobacter steynii]NQX42347.1 relaxase/mobilization nuclease domain-containing protein [Pedobacter steynii]SDO02884.1 Relaxase/Mobilisation nuclease domain-containing protein [Pedobacter steynii]
MVAKINAGKSIRGALHYNENKVNEGEANLIMASGFAGEIEQMNFNQKLNRFQHLLELNPNVKTNAVHISLNFHSSENLDNSELQQIANSYMEKMGYDDQPFLVYRHDDAAHMHVHIVTTNITAQGKRIDLHNNALKSEEARKAIEEEYNLVKAESKMIKQNSGIIKADPQKVKYGKIPTKRAISNVITAVTRDYKFTSLAEYNAVLKCFNVTALRGAEHTPMYENKGLMFSLLDAKGISVGVPVKASSFYSKPTLRNLEQKFEGNAEKRKQYKVNLKQRIDQVFGKYSNITRSRFEEEAGKLGIHVAFRENEQGFVFGTTFIDHRNKVVFNGSDLGKDYSAKAITEKFSKVSKQINPEKKSTLRLALRREQKAESASDTYLKLPNPTHFLEKLLETSRPEYVTGMPRKRKKRKKRNQQINQELTL